VVAGSLNRKPTTWIASINSTALGEFLERDKADIRLNRSHVR